MSGIARGLAAIFDGDKGAFLSVVLIALLVGGVILLVLNLSAKARGPPPPKWEAVPDETPAPAPSTASASPPTTPRKAPARRRT